jgi:hypothetical protein
VINPVTPTTAANSVATPASSKTTGTSGDANKAFEQMLVQQLTQEMLKTVTSLSSDDDSGDGGSASGLGGAYASMLPAVMADAVEQNGGLGLDFGLGKVGS